MPRFGIADDQLMLRTTRKGHEVVKTNERAGTRAQHRYVRVSAYKAREVLDLIRGLPVDEALDVLRYTDRAVAQVISKVLQSAIANARENDQQDEAELFVSACYADEGPTLKRWRPRARGRATRIRKRTCHVTIIVGRMPRAMSQRVHDKRAARVAGAARPTGRAASESRRARVAQSRKQRQEVHDHDHDHEDDLDHEDAEVGADLEPVTEEPVTEVVEEPVTEEPVTEAEETESEATEGEAQPVDEDDTAPDDDAGEEEKS
jgi:large subunit ribosomal protein L22